MNARGFPLWQAMTTAEIRALAADDPVVVLPMAAIEQHGPHLPLSTDLDIVLGLLRTAADRLHEECAVLQLPPMAIATSAEHGRFPGTLSLEPETALSVIAAYGEAVARAGMRRLVFANGHGGNSAIMDLAALRLRRDHGLLVIKCSYFRLAGPPGLSLPAGELRHGLHAGAIETAMMAHLHPESVRMDRRADAVSLGYRLERTLKAVSPEGPVAFAWLTGDLHPSGAVGNALLGTADLGARLVAHYGAAIAEVIREAAAFPLDALRGQPG